MHVLVTIQYIKWSQEKTAKKDQDVTLLCSVKAFPFPNMAWKKDGELVTNDSHHHLVTRRELKIFQVSADDMGRYYCIAWNRGTVQAKRILLLITGVKLSSFAIIDLFPLSGLLLHFRPCDDTLKNSFF